MANGARIVLQQRLTQQLVMTPQLRQAIKILQVSRAELETLIDQELIENPVLEEKEPEEKALEGEYEVPTVDGLKTTTDEYAAEAPTEVEQASSIDQAGYLTLTTDEIAFLANVWPETARVEAVLARVQQLDPPGVAARDLPECLLIQLRQLGCADDSLPSRIVRDHLGLLESRRFDRLARELGVTVEQIGEATKVISMLEPKPGRDFYDGETRYATPDVYVHKVGEEWVVTLNEDGLPRLRGSSVYGPMLGQGGSEAKGYIQEKIRASAWLIKSIHQRQRTLYM